MYHDRFVLRFWLRFYNMQLPISLLYRVYLLVQMTLAGIFRLNLLKIQYHTNGWLFEVSLPNQFHQKIQLLNCVSYNVIETYNGNIFNSHFFPLKMVEFVIEGNISRTVGCLDLVDLLPSSNDTTSW